MEKAIEVQGRRSQSMVTGSRDGSHGADQQQFLSTLRVRARIARQEHVGKR
jgi:hypothetical protein